MVSFLVFTFIQGILYFSTFLIYLFGVFRPTRELFHSYGDVTMTGEGLQIFALCSALKAVSFL